MLALFVETASDRAFFLVDIDGVIMTWNRGAEILTGWTAAEAVNQSCAMLYPAADVAIGRPLSDLARARAAETQDEAWRVRKDGSEFLADVTTTALRAADGHLHGYGQMVHDITDRKAAETALDRSVQHLRSILATVPAPMVVTDESGMILSFSATAEHLFGYSADEVTGRHASTLMPWPDQHIQKPADSGSRDDGEGQGTREGRIVAGRRRDGSAFPMELWVGEVQSDGHRIFNGFVRDLSDKQRAELRLQELQSELIHVSRLSAMGTMASTLAHELNQPLTAIANYLEAGSAILDRYKGGAASTVLLREAFAESTRETLRAGTIVRSMRAFVTHGDVEKTVENLATLIDEASRLALIGAGARGIRAIYELDSDIYDVLVDRVQIQQVLVNLVRNAVEAMETVPQREIVIRTKADGAGMVRVSVHDTGSGIDPVLAPKLFGAFATTKESGMGLGLSICRTIVEAHGGRIWAEPGAPGGTVFHFTLMQGDGDVPHE